MQLMSPSAILAAIAAFPATVTVNAHGKETREVCHCEDDVHALLDMSKFRNSIDHAEIVAA